MYVCTAVHGSTEHTHLLLQAAQKASFNTEHSPRPHPGSAALSTGRSFRRVGASGTQSSSFERCHGRYAALRRRSERRPKGTGLRQGREEGKGSELREGTPGERKRDRGGRRGAEPRGGRRPLGHALRSPQPAYPWSRCPTPPSAARRARSRAGAG